MALAALCEDTEWGFLWRDVLQHRFSTEGALNGHALGNLLIAGLWSRTGDVIEGLDWVARLLRAQGRVLPLASEALQISADVEFEDGVREVTGQVAVATAPGRISRVWLDPVTPKVPKETLAAIAEADHVILGPGSWYSSVLPHFLVAPVAKELSLAGSRSIVSLNIAHEDDETIGMGRFDDLNALRRVAPDFHPAVVIVDESHIDDPGLRALIEDLGARTVVRAMLREGTVDRHDPKLLADAYREAFGLIHGGECARK